MRFPILPFSPLPLALLPLLALACSSSATPAQTGASSGGSQGNGVDAGTAADDASSFVPPWRFEAAAVTGLPVVWGASVATESSTVAYVAGGMGGMQGPASTKLVRLEQTASGPTATVVSSVLSDRYCACALLDTKRHEMVLVGGRDGTFTQVETAELVDTTTGVVTPLDAGDAAKHPVGCHAIFLPDRDEGYLFGGASETAGFSDQIFRYTPADHKFALLPAKGPSARYDGALRYPAPGGSIWLLGGLGAGGAPSGSQLDVWKFDPAAATWSAVASGGAAPPARRYPWTTFSADGTAVVLGFGTSTLMGTTMIADLWKLDTATGAWSELAVDPSGMPAPRGFAGWLPGPSGTVGLLSGGLEEQRAATQAVVLRAPTPTDGWH